jgi:hypothetical protein
MRAADPSEFVEAMRALRQRQPVPVRQ